MARELSREQLKEADLQEFLEKESSFAFELETQLALIGRGYECEHGGTYHDPVTSKPRQFDLRARRIQKSYRFSVSIRLAVECKKLHHGNPLLVSCVPRTFDESFFYLYMRHKYDSVTKRRPLEVEPIRSPYSQGDGVGKSLDQVGRAATKDKELVVTNSDIYEKWSQAVASCHDLLPPLCVDSNAPDIILVLPVLVVPDETLWQVDFDGRGSVVTPPRKVDETTFYLGHRVHREVEHRIGHLHIVTSRGLLGLDAALSDEFLWRQVGHSAAVRLQAQE